MSPGRSKRKPKKPPADPAAPRPKFAPAAFLSGSSAEVQRLCDELADLAATRFGDLAGTTWERVGQSLASQLRALGHDLTSFEESAELQEWQAIWHLPRGTFTFLLEFRAPCAVVVTWKTDTETFVAER